MRMSKLAAYSLVLLAICGLTALWAPSEAARAVSQYGMAIFSLSTFAGLLIGRRVKFDPILR
ncbi:PA3371 family protein [Stutzerimonas balearica]